MFAEYFSFCNIIVSDFIIHQTQTTTVVQRPDLPTLLVTNIVQKAASSPVLRERAVVGVSSSVVSMFSAQSSEQSVFVRISQLMFT